jgi:hypothetical protein
MEHMKQSTSRDFRINVAALQEVSESEEEDEEDITDGDTQDEVRDLEKKYSQYFF